MPQTATTLDEKNDAQDIQNNPLYQKLLKAAQEEGIEIKDIPRAYPEEWQRLEQSNVRLKKAMAQLEKFDG